MAAYTALGGSVTDTSLNTYYYATFSSSQVGTTSPGTGLNVGTSVSNGTVVRVSNGNWSKDGTTWSTLNTTFVNQNDTLYFRAATANLNSIKLTHSLTIGTTTHSFSTFTEGPNEYGIQTFNSDGILNFDTSSNIATFYEVVSGTLSSGTSTTDITLSTNEIPTTAVVIDLSAKAWLFADPSNQTVWGVLVNVSGTKKLRVSRTGSSGSTSYDFAIVGTELLQNY